ncbi:MAG: AMIN-like domain-containing (lipo)protein [Haloechinothrix sp.]
MRGLGITVALVALAFTAACVGSDPDPDDPGYFGDQPTTTRTAPPAATSAPAAAPAAPAAPSAVPTPLPSCPATGGWNTAADEGPGQSTEELFRVRAGKHDCFDRVVFDVKGTDPVGFLVKYVPVVRADGSGNPVPVNGGAALQVIVRSSIQGYPDGQNMLAASGDYFYPASQLAGWTSLRAVRFAGFFEGQSTTAIGVREQLPFRAFTVVNDSTSTRQVIVDIAHR